MQRIVTRLPLLELCDDTGLVLGELARDLTVEDIRRLLRAGPVRFVVASVGSPLRWVPVAECFQFWKREVQSRVAGATAYLEDFPSGYCYFASEWRTVEGPPVVVLAVAH